MSGLLEKMYLGGEIKCKSAKVARRMIKYLKAPFPYFGGKRNVAGEVWRRLGAVRSYIEPFCGSMAVLLARPEPFRGVETVADTYGMLVNFWRSVQFSPGLVAEKADMPLIECNLIAIQETLALQDFEKFNEWLSEGFEKYMTTIAGYWLWIQCASINGTDSKVLHLGRPSGFKAQEFRNSPKEMLSRISARIKNVRITCGSWERLLTPTLTRFHGVPVGIFLDPPYGVPDRSEVYKNDSREISEKVLAWCLDNGKNYDFRIALCGYDGEYNVLEAGGWEKFSWAADGGMATTNRKNRHRKRVWFSPGCLKQIH